MAHRLPLLAAFLALAPVVRADDALPAEVVGAVKAATVFVRAEGDGWGASGTGFVVAADDKAVLIATNHHVATPAPPPAARGGKAVALSVVFDSGTKSEKSYPAAVVGSDPERDLAVLRVEGVKAPPKPLANADPTKVVETASVYSFGFPFGKALSSDKGFPTVTVGKASVSSLRNGPDGELAAIQIDGNLNPGNSGGPVVDAKGNLVGVAQSVIKEGKGIGFIVPAGELTRMMDGRVGTARLLPPTTADGKTTARVEVKVIDPAGNLKAVSVRYLFVPAKGKRPDVDTLAKHPDAKTVELKVADGVAAADLPLASADGEVLVQVTAEPKGKAAVVGRVQPLSLAAAVAGPPVLVPRQPAAPGKEATILGGVFDPVYADPAPDGGILIGLELGMGDWFGKPAPRAFRPIYRVGEKEVFGEQRGTKPKDPITLKAKAGYAVGGISATVGLCCDGLTLTFMKVADGGKLDPKESYDSEPAGGFDKNRASKQVSDGNPVVGVVGKTNERENTVTGFGLWFKGQDPPKKGPVVGGPAQPGTGKEATIIAGAFDPVFSEAAPEGAVLVGLEVGTAPVFGRQMTRSFRPIYRKGEKESFGEQWGAPPKDVTTLKAKSGYAVGAMSVMSGLCFDGLSVTFMKITDGGKLDPKESYESDYVGCDEKKPLAKHGGDGTPVVGVVGKTNEREKTVTGFGLLFKGQDPPPKK